MMMIMVTVVIVVMMTMMMMIMTMIMPKMLTSFDVISLLLFQPVDVSHIYVPDLHEQQQRRVPKKNGIKRGSEVRLEK